MAYIIVITWLVVIATSEGLTNIVVCPSKLLYHIPCPGCGITRATIMGFRGDFFIAIKLNPNVVLSISFVITYPLLAIASLLSHKHLIPYTYKLLDRKLKNKIVLCIVLLSELTIWICNIYNGV